MHTNKIDVSDLRSAKFYHLFAKYDNGTKSIDKEFLIVVDAHLVYYQVRSFGTMVKETTDMNAALEFYNKLGEFE